MTVDALGPVPHLGEMVTLGIKGFGHLQHLARAEFDTIFTALAPLLDDHDLAPARRDRFKVKGNSPIFHFFSLFSPRVEVFGKLHHLKEGIWWIPECPLDMPAQFNLDFLKIAKPC
jgi:hypothetical protein